MFYQCAATLRWCFPLTAGVHNRTELDELILRREVWLPLFLLQVFFSAYIFNSNVMVKVATQPAENPIDVLSRKLHLGPGMGRDVPRLSLPGKLVFPRYDRCHHRNSGWSASALFVPSVPGVLLLLYHKVWFRHFGQRRRKWQTSQQIPLVHSKFLKGWELFESSDHVSNQGSMDVLNGHTGSYGEHVDTVLSLH